MEREIIDNMNPGREIVMNQPRRQRYSMNYQCYESAQVSAKEKHRRMIDYMFPGYELKDTRTWHERNEQTDLSFWNFTGSTEKLKDENDFKDYVEEKTVEKHINLRDAILLCDENTRSASLAPHGWVGPPLTIKLKLFDMLFMEVTNVAKNPRLIKMHSNALDESTLKIQVLPGPKYVPQVMITLGSKKIFPEGEKHKSVINEQIIPRYPSTLFTSINGENTKDMRSFMNTDDQVQFRFNEFLTNNESVPIEKQEVYLPKSWTDVIKMEAPILVKKEYRLHTYDIKHEDEVTAKCHKPLKVILPERDDLDNDCRRKIVTDTNLADDKVYLFNPFTKMENLPKNEEDQDVQDHLRLKSHRSEIWETINDDYETPTPPPNDDYGVYYKPDKLPKKCIPKDYATPLIPEVSYVVPLDRKKVVYATPLPSPKHSYVVPVTRKEVVYASPLPSPNRSYAIPVGKFVKNSPFLQTQIRAFKKEKKI